MKQILEQSILWGALISFLAYEFGLFMKKKFKLAIFNPLLVASICVIGIIVTLDLNYESYQEGAKYISYFLTPATVCLAVPLYEQLALLRKNWLAIFVGIVAGVLANMIGVFFLGKVFGLNHVQYVTLLPKSITTAIGMGVSEELGGMVTITVTVIVLTGVLGNVMGVWLCRVFRISHPVAKGLAIGTASHAAGTAKAMEIGEIEGAMSSLAIAVAGVLTVLVVPLFANLL